MCEVWRGLGKGERERVGRRGEEKSRWEVEKKKEREERTKKRERGGRRGGEGKREEEKRRRRDRALFHVDFANERENFRNVYFL